VNLDHDLFTYIKQSIFYFGSNVSFCRHFMKIFFKEPYVTNITYLQVTGKPSQEIILIMAADDAVHINIRFKQLPIAVDSYAAMNCS